MNIIIHLMLIVATLVLLAVLAMCAMVVRSATKVVHSKIGDGDETEVETPETGVVIGPGETKEIPFKADIGFGANEEGQITVALHLHAGDACEKRNIALPSEVSLSLATRVLLNQGEDGRKAAESVLNERTVH